MGVEIDEVTLECREQESAQAAALRVRAGERFLFDDAREKILRRVLRVRRFETTATCEAVEWIPVGGAQFIECRRASGMRVVSRAEHEAPAGRFESAGIGNFGTSHKPDECPQT